MAIPVHHNEVGLRSSDEQMSFVTMLGVLLPKMRGLETVAPTLAMVGPVLVFFPVAYQA